MTGHQRNALPPTPLTRTPCLRRLLASSNGVKCFSGALGWGYEDGAVRGLKRVNAHPEYKGSKTGVILKRSISFVRLVCSK